MGPKKRLITAAAAAAAGATTTERQQRSSSNTVATAKKRPTSGKAHSSPVVRKPIAVASNVASLKRATHGRTPSPAKKQQTVISKEHERDKEAESGRNEEKTDGESKVSVSLETKQGELITPNIDNAEACEEIFAKDQLKTKHEQREELARSVAHTIKSTKRTPSRENVKKSNTSETKEKSSCTSNKKVATEKQKADSEPPSTSATSAIGSKSKAEDRKDGKNKAISKMLKSLDIQISGFDNILPSEERIQDTLKSSISENVKTKSRAAAVKVIASLNPPKSNIARIKARQEEDRREKAKEKEKEKDKEKDKDKYKGKEKEKEKVEEKDFKCKETGKLLDAAQLHKQTTNINTEEVPVTHVETQKSNNHTLVPVKEDTTKSSESQASLSEMEKNSTAKMAPKKKVTAKRVNKTEGNQKNKKAPSPKSHDDESKAQKQISNPINDAIAGTPLKKRLLKAKPIKKSTEEAKEENVGTNMPTEEKPDKQSCKAVEPPDPPDEDNEKAKAEKTPKKTPSPKKVKMNPKNPDKCNIQEPEKTVDEPLELIEKEETLRIVLDANTEVVQMDIEEMPVCASAPKEVELKKEELDVKQQKAEAENVKQEPLKQEKTTEKATSSAPCSPLIRKKQFSNIKHRLQSKYKVPPMKSCPTAKIVGKKSKFTQKLAVDKSNNSAANDIYDFRSGSEEEDNIKMDLPTLKNLREFADEEHKTKSTKESLKSKQMLLEVGEMEAKVEEVPHKKEEQLAEPVREENKKSIENSEAEGKAKGEAEENIAEALDKAEENSTAVAQTTSKTKKVIKSKVTKKVYKKKPLITKKIIKTVKGKMLQKTEKPKAKSSKVRKDSSTASSDSEDEKKLIDFGPKRHRMASLNALAKVQCLYENESRTAYELGLSKATQLPPKIRTVDGSEDEKDKDKDKEKDKEKDKDKNKEKETDEKVKSKNDKKNEDATKADEPQKAESEDEPQEVEPKRELRHVPGGRGLGKHWEFEESGDSEDEEIDKMKLKRKKLQKKLANKKEKEAEKLREKERKEEEASGSKISKAKEDKEKDAPKEKEIIRVKRKYTKIKKPLKKIVKLKTDSSDGGDNTEASDNEDRTQEKEKKVQKAKLEARKPPKKRKRMLREELIGDYKGILARKRMASLNASAIVAATYEVERHLDKNLSYGSYDSTDGEEKTSTPAKKSKDVAKDTKKTSTATVTTDLTLNTKDNGEGTTNITATANSSNASNASGTARESRPLNLNEESNDSKYSKETKETNTDTTTTAGFRDSGSTKDAKDSSRPTSSSVVIVQDTDVTITGVYVNSTTGSSQEAYCKMQYRVQSSVTEERVLRPSSVDPPKSYTPLSALSSMLPPGASTGGAMSDCKLYSSCLFI